jgi:hypothetical protein
MMVRDGTDTHISEWNNGMVMNGTMPAGAAIGSIGNVAMVCSYLSVGLTDTC